MVIRIYLGLPDVISVGQGKNIFSAEVRSNFQAAGILLNEAPIDTPGSIGTVKRYHAPLRLAFEIIRIEMGTEASDGECLKMVLFSVNSTTGPAGLCAMLLAFGALPRSARFTPAPTQLARSHAIEAAFRDAEK